VLFAWPDVADALNEYEIAVPHLGSLILTHDWNGLVPGLKSAPPQDRPPVPFVFFAFRLMIGIWALMLGLVLVGAWLRWRRRLYDTRWFHLACAVASPLPFLAVLSGWTVTEVGRQPFVVYGHLRTADAVSPIAPQAVFGSLALFIAVYTALLLAFFFYAARTVLRGPEVHEPAQQPNSVRPGLDAVPAGRAPVGE
jgi:cytochrome bd ubiquinol oxidase subunit I